VLYVQDIFQIRQINDIYWTLCLEIQFYLIFCLLMWAFHSLRRDKRDRRWLYGLFVPALAVAAALFYAFVALMCGGFVRAGSRGDYKSALFTGACTSTAVLLMEAGRKGKIGT